MSFAETRLDLGIDYNTRGSLRYSASIIVDGVGNEQRNASWGQPLGRWQIGDRTLSRLDLDYFLKFHAARKGARHGFRFKDWADYKVLRQPIGIGDGTTRQFQLTKTYTVGSSSVKRPILKPVGGTIKIYLNRIEHLDDWTIDVTQGIVTFNAAPDSDTVITADFEFDVPVRFEQDRIEFRFDAHDSNSHDAIFYLASLSCAELRLLPTLPIAPDPIGSTLEEILNLGYDYGTLGGPTYDTTITTVGANYEARVDNWETSRGRWQIGDRTVTRSEMDYLIAIHRVARGSASGFIYKDWASSRNVPVRFEQDNIEFRFDAYNPETHEAIFYLAGLSVIEIVIKIARSLNGLRWELPCTSNISSYACFCAAQTVTSTVMDGASGRTYNVTIRFRGVVEYKAYSGGSNDGEHFQIGGIPSNNFYNIYKLEISNPPQIFYLNKGTESERCYAIDYTKTIQIASNATVTLTANSIEGVQLKNRDGFENPIVVPDIVPYPNPYDGQFIQMDVVSVN